ncbi:MAG TPA: PKD domain-containing protein, partial [Chitinophagales bacterium]|nr:PKD domain-containing protein [Chitinophagales bacterium]
VTFTLSNTPPTGCPTYSSQTIVLQAPLQPIITALGNLALCEGESVNLSIPPIYAQVEWSTGVSGQYSISVASGGNYQVTVTNTNACTGVSPAIAVNVSALPTAAFVSSGGTDIQAGTSISFFNNSSGASYYRWLINGVLSSTSEDFTYLFNSYGTYLLTLEATNTNGCTAVSSQTITVNNTTTETLFYGTPTLGSSPLMVEFYHNTNNSTAFFWDFGDGSSSTLPNPQHLYTAPGIYSVALARLTDGVVVNEERPNYILVQSNTPEAVADFSATPTTGSAALTVGFTNLSVGASSYAWTFLNSAGQIIGSSSEVNPQFTFALPGVYSVCLAAIGAINTDIECKEQYINVVSQFVDGDLCIVAPQTVTPGEEFSVEVWANDLTLLVKAINPILTYNTQHLNWTGIELGDFFSNGTPGITLDNPVLGELQMGITSNTAANGTGMLFRLSFVVQPEPDEPTDISFGFSLTEAIDNNNNIVALYTCGNPTTTIETGEFVWPGDANANDIVDNFDYIFAAANFNVTGNARNVQGISWQPYNAPAQWDATMPYLGEMVNLMHSDASGNGWINNTDISATIINQGLTHGRVGLIANELSDAPALFPDMPTEAHQGDMLLVPVMLGDSLTSFSNLQGITFDLQIDTTLLDLNTLDIDYYDSVMGSIGLDFSANFIANNNGIVNMVMARNGLFPISGHGKLFDLRIKVKETAAIDSYATMEVYNLSGLDGNLNLLELSTAQDSSHIVPVISLGNNAPVWVPTINNLKVYPNPTADRLMVELPDSFVGATDFVLCNTAGQIVYHCRLY